MTHEDENVGRATITHRALVIASIVGMVAVLGLLLWAVVDVLLLIFGGLLVTCFLHGLSDLLSRYTRLPDGWSLVLVVLENHNESAWMFAG